MRVAVLSSIFSVFVVGVCFGGETTLRMCVRFVDTADWPVGTLVSVEFEDGKTAKGEVYKDDFGSDGEMNLVFKVRDRLSVRQGREVIVSRIDNGKAAKLEIRWYQLMTRE